MNAAPARLFLPLAHRQAMIDHAQACLPEEACGVLGGLLEQGGHLARVERTLLVENELHSPVRFRMAPVEQLNAFQALEAGGLELVGFFHSHPKGPPRLSPTDLAEFGYPGVLALILFPSVYAAIDGDIAVNGGWKIRAFAIQGVYSPDLSFIEVPVDGLDL